MRQFGLIGYPLSHSFSKKYFTEKFAKAKLIDHQYENYAIPAIDDLQALLENNPMLEGLNVTIPYKKQVLPFLFRSSAVVEEIKACNCIKIEDGKLWGFNTDVIGFELSLKPNLKVGHRQALVLGTGGAAQAVVFVLKKLGIAHQFVSRQASGQSVGYSDLNAQTMASHTLIINTTPLGMYPGIAECPPIPYEALTDQHYLFDLVYNPEKTLFLNKGEARGAITKNGYDMLEIQAEESWKIWNGEQVI